MIEENIDWIFNSLNYHGEYELYMDYWRRWPAEKPLYIRAEVLDFIDI